jgi:hypothetical protein
MHGSSGLYDDLVSEAVPPRWQEGELLCIKQVLLLSSAVISPEPLIVQQGPVALS